MQQVPGQYNRPYSNTAPMPLPWDPSAAAACRSELELRAYSSRLLGSDAELVLYGGGNTSLKGSWTTADGLTVPCLFVKGSGADLAQVDVADFTPIALDEARALLDAAELDNAGLMAALAPITLCARAPRPSIETLLHAAIPHRYVEHTHADSILAIANTRSGRALCARVFGERAPVVPFRHSGFDLAKVCAATHRAEATATTIGLILEFHGVVAFGDDARTSYENMLRLVDRAECYLRSRDAWTLPERRPSPVGYPDALALAGLRRELSLAAGFPMVLAVDRSATTMGFVTREDLAALALQGPPTPQHAVFTKRVPMLGRDVTAYVATYREYLAAAGGDAFDASMLPDPAPRIVLDPTWGLVGASVDAAHAAMAREVYLHDIAIISRASMHDRYVSLPPAAILLAEVHYGGFERTLRARVPRELPLLGIVVLLRAGTGAAALAAALLDAGAAVVLAGERVGAEGKHPKARHALVRWEAAEPREPSDEALSELATAFGGIDFALLSPGREAFAARLGPLLAQSPAGGATFTLADAGRAAAREGPGTHTIGPDPGAVVAALAEAVHARPSRIAS